MKQHETILMFGLMGLSVISSFLLISYGMGVILSDQAAHGVVVFAYVTTGHGMANVAILSVAWTTRAAWAIVASKLISLCFLGVFVMDMINSNMKTGLGAAGILVLALVLCANWLAVKKVVERS